MKEFAKTLVRNRVRAGKREVVERAAPPPLVHGEILDTWSAKNRAKLLLPEAAEEQPTRINRRELPQIIGDKDFESMEPELLKREFRRLAKNRKTTMTISMSVEEECIIRNFLAKDELNFSSWAREAIFDKIGMKIPPRPKRKSTKK